MAKRKTDHPQAEADLTPGTRATVEGSAEEEIASGAVTCDFTPAGPGNEGMEAGLFEDLLGSVRETGAILRGEREAARRVQADDLGASEDDTARCAADPDLTREEGNVPGRD